MFRSQQEKCKNQWQCQVRKKFTRYAQSRNFIRHLTQAVKWLMVEEECCQLCLRMPDLFLLGCELRSITILQYTLRLSLFVLSRLCLQCCYFTYFFISLFAMWGISTWVCSIISWFVLFSTVFTLRINLVVVLSLCLYFRVRCDILCVCVLSRELVQARTHQCKIFKPPSERKKKKTPKIC